MQQAQKQAKESLIDFAEGVLKKKVREEDLTALIFFLKTQGRYRGYQEKQEIEHSGQVNITVNFQNE